MRGVNCGQVSGDVNTKGGEQVSSRRLLPAFSVCVTFSHSVSLTAAGEIPSYVFNFVIFNQAIVTFQKLVCL